MNESSENSPGPQEDPLASGRRGPGRLSPLRSTVLAVCCAAAAVALVHHPMLRNFRRMQTDPGDTRLCNYFLEHTYLWANRTANHTDLWSPPFFYPARNVYAHSELLLSLSPFYWIWRLAGFPPDSSFQLWMMTMTALNFLSAFALLRWGLGVEAAPAAAGGLLFAIGSPRAVQVGHQALLGHVFAMTALLAAFRLFRPADAKEAQAGAAWKRGAPWAAVFFGSLVAASYGGFYTTFFLVLGLGTAAVWACLISIFRRSWRQAVIGPLRRQGLAIVVCAALAVGAMAPLLRHYLAAARDVGPRAYEEVQTMLPRPQSWIYMGPWNVLYGGMAKQHMFQPDRLPMAHEQQMGIGFVALPVVLAGLFLGLRRRGVLLVLLASLTLMIVATTFPAIGGSLWRAVYEVVPGAKAIRAVSRIGILLLIPAAVGFALFVERALRARRPLMVFAAGCIAAICLVEQLQKSPSYDKKEVRQQVQQIASRVAPGCEAFFLTAPGSDQPDYKLHLDAMWAGLETGKPTLNGHSGSAPPGWDLHRIGADSPDAERRIEEAIRNWTAARGLDPARIQILR